MVGESSTTKKFAFSSGTIGPSRCGCQQVEEALDRVQLSLRLRVEFRGENRRRGMRGKEREELVVDGRERVFLLEKFVDDHQADDMFLDLERHGGERLFQRHLATVFHVLVDVVALAGLGHAAENTVAEAYRDGLDSEHDVLTLRGNRLQLVGLLVKQQNGERLRADEVDD